MSTLSPADLGIPAAALAAALPQDFGDDDRCVTIANAALANDIAATEAEAWSTAYDPFRADV